MITRRQFFLAPGILAVPGCLRPKQPTDDDSNCGDGPAEGFKADCRIRPVVPAGGQAIDWGLIESKLNSYYYRLGITFLFEPVWRNAPQDIRTAGDWASICDTQKNHYDILKELCITFPEKISYYAAAGVANYPSNVAPYNFGIAVCFQLLEMGNALVLAHELGHYLGLPHPWEDSFGDTEQRDKSEGCSRQGCNVMNYCDWTNCNTDDWFTPQQVGCAQRWAVSPQRRNAMFLHTIPKVLSTFKLLYTNNTKPQVDREESWL